MTRFLRWVPLFVAIVLVASPADAQTSGRNRNRIFREEIEQSQASNVYDLIRAQRPTWISRRHATSFTGDQFELLLYVDGARLDNLNELKAIAATDVERVEFLTAAQAQFRFGHSSPNGAIVVVSRAGPPTG